MVIQALFRLRSRRSYISGHRGVSGCAVMRAGAPGVASSAWPQSLPEKRWPLTSASRPPSRGSVTRRCRRARNWRWLTEPELRMLHSWLDSWRAIGDVLRGMARQGWDVQLIGGTAWEPTPWRAVQRAAWAALARPM